MHFWNMEEAERKTLYDDLEVLRVFGLDIEKRKEKPSVTML